MLELATLSSLSLSPSLFSLFFSILQFYRYGVLPKGLLTFLGFLGNAEFSPWKRTPELIELRMS